MGRDEAITAIQPALAPLLERRIGNDHIAPENEVSRPLVIRVAGSTANSGCTSCVYRVFVTGFLTRTAEPGIGIMSPYLPLSPRITPKMDRQSEIYQYRISEQPSGWQLCLGNRFGESCYAPEKR
jgi:hypothetical protein